MIRNHSTELHMELTSLTLKYSQKRINTKKCHSLKPFPVLPQQMSATDLRTSVGFESG